MYIRPLFCTSIIVTLILCLRNPAFSAEIRTFQQGVGGYSNASDLSLNFAGTNLSASFPGTVRIDYPDAGQPDGNYGYLKLDNIFGGGPNQIPTSHIVLQNATLTGFVTNTFGSANIDRLLQDISLRPMSPNRLDDAGVAGTFYDPIGATATGIISNPIVWDVTSIVQAWLNGEPNLGVLLVPNTNDGGNIVSSTGATLAQRPLLSVEFELLPPAPEPNSLLLLAGVSLIVLVRRKSRILS